jgi:hypothetical protein
VQVLASKVLKKFSGPKKNKKPVILCSVRNFILCFIVIVGKHGKLRWEKRECIQNFRGKTSWKTFTLITDKEWEDNIKLDLGDICLFKDWMWMKMGQNGIEWRTVLNLHFPLPDY